MDKVIATTKIPDKAEPYLKRLWSQHKIEILKLEDPSQFYAFLVNCSCGHQGRFYTFDKAKEHVYQHSGQEV